MGEAAESNVVPMRQLSLDPGGATVDVSAIGTISIPKELKDLEQVEFKKGSDVKITLTARVVDISFPDHYDSHGNIAKTERLHHLRVDDVESVDLVTARAYKTAAEYEEELAEKRAAEGDGAVGGGIPTGEGDAADENPEPDPFADGAAGGDGDEPSE
jgi:hypothetical protein